MELVRVLQESSNEDLEYLVNYIKEKADFTETLTGSPGYRAHHPNHSMYVDEIVHEIRLFGGNTIANKYRGCPPIILPILAPILPFLPAILAPILPFLPGEGPPYKEIVQDVANKLGVNYEYYDSVERVEMKIIKEILNRSLKGMSDKKKEEVFKAFKKEGGDNLDFSAGSPLALLMAATVANGIAKMVLGRVIGGIGGRVITILAGPIGWVITGIWTAISIAGPAYRVTIPCVCHVAYLRHKIQAREDFGGDE